MNRELQPSDRWARWSYDRFRLAQPHVEDGGLWNLGERFYICCPSLSEDMLAYDGSPLSEWLNLNRAVTSPIDLVREPPPGAVRVPERDLEDIASLRGEPLTVPELRGWLSLQLPRPFPVRDVRDEPQASMLVVVVDRPLSVDEDRDLANAIEDLQQPFLRYTVQVRSADGADRTEALASTRDPAILLPSHALPDRVSQPLRALWEQDEDFWATNGVRAMTSSDLPVHEDLPSPSWARGVSRCLVFGGDPQPLDLRNYLSMYRKVAVVVPPSSDAQEFCTGLGITEPELIGLMELGRVQLVLPHSIDRYPLRTLEAAAERASGELLMSRRLAALAISDARRRLPLLYLSFTTTQRATILRELHEAAQRLSDPTQRQLLQGVVLCLGATWGQADRIVHTQGAMGAALVGFGQLVGAIFRSAIRIDRQLEFLNAGLAVEWAGALRAVAFPFRVAESSGVDPYTEILASLYSGLPIQGVPRYVDNLQILVSELLSVSKDVPALEFARAFGGGDIDRFRDLVGTLLLGNADLAAIQEAAARFNAEIRSYERRSECLQAWDLKGLLLDLAAPKIIPLAGWVLGRLVAILEARRSGSPGIGAVMDSLEAMATGVHPPAVLVSRMRAAVKMAV